MVAQDDPDRLVGQRGVVRAGLAGQQGTRSRAGRRGAGTGPAAGAGPDRTASFPGRDLPMSCNDARQLSTPNQMREEVGHAHDHEGRASPREPSRGADPSDPVTGSPVSRTPWKGRSLARLLGASTVSLTTSTGTGPARPDADVDRVQRRGALGARRPARQQPARPDPAPVLRRGRQDVQEAVTSSTGRSARAWSPRPRLYIAPRPLSRHGAGGGPGGRAARPGRVHGAVRRQRRPVAVLDSGRLTDAATQHYWLAASTGETEDPVGGNPPRSCPTRARYLCGPLRTGHGAQGRCVGATGRSRRWARSSSLIWSSRYPRRSRRARTHLARLRQQHQERHRLAGFRRRGRATAELSGVVLVAAAGNDASPARSGRRPFPGRSVWAPSARLARPGLVQQLRALGRRLAPARDW